VSGFRFALGFAVTMARRTFNLFQVLRVVGNQLVHLFRDCRVRHAIVSCFEVDKSVAHLSVLRTSACLNLQIDAKSKILPFNPFYKAAFGLSRLPRLTSLNHGCSSQVRNRGWSSIIIARWDNIIDYDPAMITSCEDSVHILRANTRHMLESRFRFSIRETSKKLQSLTLTISRATRTQSHKCRPSDS